MTTIPLTGGSTSPTRAQSRQNINAIQKIPRDRRFIPLDSQLCTLPQVSDHICRKHWPKAEREQYPFWIGVLFLGLLAIAGQFTRDIQWVGLAVAGIMLVGLFIVVFLYMRNLSRRFGRQWASMSEDGELFKHLRDAGMVLGYPVEMGKPDENFATHIDLDFPLATQAVEDYIRESALPDPVPPDAPPGLAVPAQTLREPAGGDAHRVYEVEYRGCVTAPMSIRVSRADSGTDIVLGFPLKPAGAESRDKLISGVLIRLQYRLIAAKILGDIREVAGAPALKVPMNDNRQFNAGPQVSRAI